MNEGNDNTSAQVNQQLETLLPIRAGLGLAESAVDARTLWATLEVGRDFSNWLKQRLFESFAVEGTDYCVLDGTPNLANGNLKPRIEYALTVDTAKSIAMLERTPKGKAIRDYFIEAEKRSRVAFNPALVSRSALANMVLDAERELEAAAEQNRVLKAENAVLEPLASGYQQVVDAAGLHDLGTVAKILGTGRNRLFEILRREKVLLSAQDSPPFQEHVDAGRFRVKAAIAREGTTYERRYSQTLVTGKGLEYIRRLLIRIQEPVSLLGGLES